MRLIDERFHDDTDDHIHQPSGVAPAGRWIDVDAAIACGSKRRKRRHLIVESEAEDEPAEQRRTATYRHERRSQPGRRRRRTGVRLVGSVAGFDPAVMAQVDGAVGSPVGDDDGADEADGPEDDADEGAPNGQSQARTDRS